MNDPLVGHLIDLVQGTPPGSFILVGGLGMALKRAHLTRQGEKTLAAELPQARVTTDIDLALRIEVLADVVRANSIREVIDQLEYEPVNPNWQFHKLLLPADNQTRFTLDLQAKLPEDESNVRADAVRVGKAKGLGLHGRTTPEAFAVEHSPQAIPISRDGREAQVLVPHPYAWINMKVRAAYDWYQYDQGQITLREGQKPPSEKHLFDVVLLVAMLTNKEIEDCEAIRKGFADLNISGDIRHEAEALFGSVTSRGWTVARQQGSTAFDHETLWEAMRLVLGI